MSNGNNKGLTDAQKREILRRLIKDQKLVIPVGDRSKIIATADLMKGKGSVKVKTKFAGPRTRKNIESREFQELQEEIAEKEAQKTSE